MGYHELFEAFDIRAVPREQNTKVDLLVVAIPL
jgi:hypothetical protein